jgi:hypothetical protein
LDDLSVNIVGGVVGAVVGSVLGYLFAFALWRTQARSSSEERRRRLQKALMHEISRIGDSPPPYDAAKFIYLDPIRLVSLAPLLEEAAEHSDEMLEIVIDLAVSISTFNDQLAVFHAEQNGAKDEIHRQMYDDAMRRRQSVLDAVQGIRPMLNIRQ